MCVTPSNRCIQTKACDTDLQKPTMLKVIDILMAIWLIFYKKREMLVVLGLHS